MEPNYKVKCTNGYVLNFYNDHVSIKQESKGFSDGKIFYYSDLQSVQFKNCGWTAGFIEFTFLELSNNKNKFYFGKSTIGSAKKLAKEMEGLKYFIDTKIQETRNKSNQNTVEPKIATAPPQNATLKYQHNEFNFFIYKSFEVTETGEKWIAKYNYDNVEIYRPDKSFREIFEYDLVDIVPEPENVYDNRAVAVKFCGNVLGYINKGTLQDMIHDFIDRNELVKAQIQTIHGDTIKIKIFFCKRREDALSHKEPFASTLANNCDEDMQNNIACCEIGDEIDAEYDYDKEKYLVFQNNIDIGYIPKSRQDIMKNMEDEGYEFSGKILDISENEDGRYAIKVEIQPK